MDQTGHDPTAALASHLHSEAHGYHFFHLVRLIERYMAGGDSEAVGLGGVGPAARERVRLRASLSMAFPAADVEGVRYLEDDDRFQVTTTFFGLGGVNSPLPRWYTEQLLWNEDEFPQQHAFLDILHHRLLSMLYRGWLLHRYDYAFEGDGRDRLSRALLALIGVSPDASAEELGIEPARLLGYLGILLLRTRPASGLEHFLSEELDLKGLLCVEPFPERWITLSRDRLFRLPAGPGREGRLGVDLFLGGRRRDCLGMLQLRIGPVERYEDLQRLAPGGQDHLRLLRLVRFYLRQPLDVRLRVLVPLRLIGPLKLSRDRPPRAGPLSLCHSGRKKDPGEETVVFRFDVPLPAGKESHVSG